MGFGLPAAIGARVGSAREFADKKPVWLIDGDGSFQMTSEELATAFLDGTPIKIALLNNSVYGMVRQWQKVFYENRFSSTDPHRKTDLVKLAEAFGCTGMRLDRAADVETVLKAALEHGGPVVVDCRISPDANVLPMIPPGGTVEDIIEEMDN